MAPRRHYARGSVPAPPSEVPERAGSSEVQELRAQMTALVGVVRRQGSLIERLQERLERLVAAAAATAIEGRGPPAPSIRALDAAEGEGLAMVPMAGLMSPRRYTRRSTPAPTPEVPEQEEPSVMDRLQAQVTALTNVVQRQENRFERLQELLERQAAAAAATATDGRDVPAPSARVPEPAEGEGIAAVPVAARPPPAIVPPAASGSATPDVTAEDVEGERALAALIKFNKFHPPTFEGEKVEPAMVESWIDSMETLFDDLRTLERDKVYLATHCLEKAAKVWWCGRGA
uniref:Retrotransposon gag domain-containing protein n=1 Tax=Ananas comosus var. bracteatus TaxID=296719 RepID=A0A6V7NGY0_ANACO|nr:unnamed protein product [Ananas comosus var. bracteatus]